MTKRKKDVMKDAPTEIAVAKAVAAIKAENALLKRDLQILRGEYDQLYRVLVVLLHQGKEHGFEELSIHRSQFLRFEEEYRIERKWDAVNEEMVFRLKMLGEE